MSVSLLRSSRFNFSRKVFTSLLRFISLMRSLLRDAWLFTSLNLVLLIKLISLQLLCLYLLAAALPANRAILDISAPATGDGDLLDLQRTFYVLEYLSLLGRNAPIFFVLSVAGEIDRTITNLLDELGTGFSFHRIEKLPERRQGFPSLYTSSTANHLGKDREVQVILGRLELREYFAYPFGVD